MKTLKNYSLHIIFLLALNIFGEAAIVVPYKNASVYSFIGFLIAAAVGILLFTVLSLFIPYKPTLSSKKGPLKFVFSLLIVMAAFGSILSAFLSVKEFLGFASEILLPKAPRLISLILIVLAVVFLALVKEETVLKFCIISAIPVILTVVILFCLSISSMKLINISVFSLPDTNRLFKLSLPYFLRIFLTAVPALIFVSGIIRIKARKGTVIWGVLLGTALLSAVVLQSMLILGTAVNSFDFPYLSAVGTLTFGNLFTRLDGFVYFLFFVGVIIKSAVCIHSAKYLFRLLKTKNSP